MGKKVTMGPRTLLRSRTKIKLQSGEIDQKTHEFMGVFSLFG
jgi:hypothetical protein